jgi:hypothetical protein
MYGIVLGVTPPGAIRKMNQDNDCLFNAKIMMNEWHDYVWYDYDDVMLLAKSKIWIEQDMNVMPMTILGFP